MQSSETHDGLREPGWFAELFVCPDCRKGSLSRTDFNPSGSSNGLKSVLRCGHCQADFPIADGIHYLFSSSGRESFHKHKVAWRRFAAVVGAKPLSDAEALQLPESPRTKDLLAWLRTWLAVRGPARILELGAGRGWASRALAENGHEVVAVDAQDDAEIGLGFAARLRNCPGPWFGCVAAAAEALPFRAECFDVVFCFATMRHILDLEALLQEVRRVLKPGGTFLAFDEPFRGALTTPAQRLQDSTCHKLARWWQPDEMPGVKIKPEVTRFREAFGSLLHEAAWRTGFYLAAAEGVKLRTSVLPTGALLTVPPDCDAPAQQILERRGWLDALADAYCLDPARLHALVNQTNAAQTLDLRAALLDHWVHLGNIDGVLLAQKQAVCAPALHQPVDYRRVDPLLLSCARRGFVPVHGCHRIQADDQGDYHWLQPQAALLIPGAESLELTIAVPPRAVWSERVCVILHLENERTPLFVFLAMPGKTVTFKVSIPPPVSQRSSVLLRLTSRIAFMPSDHALGSDTRLLALQLRGARVSSLPAEKMGRAA